jgi:hypothetical protein
MAPLTMDMAIRTQIAHVTPQIIRRGAACCIEYLAKPPAPGRLLLSIPATDTRPDALGRTGCSGMNASHAPAYRLWPGVSGVMVRDASGDDARVCAAIYAPYVCETAVSFEGEPPAPAEMAVRIAAAVCTYAWAVLEDDGPVVGYAYGGPHHKRAAYRFSCEVSVYVERGRRRTGSGRAGAAR